MCLVLASLGILSSLPSQAADYFLTISGGYSPSGNQISIERNVIYFQRVLEKTGHAHSPHSLYFGDGNAPERDVQFEPAENKVPKANRYMAKLFAREKYLDLKYKNSEIKNVDGPTTTEAIEKWFKEKGPKLKSGDRIIIYATAHGGKSSDKKKPYNTKLYLWNTKSIQAKRLAELISGLPKGVNTTLIMAQCYAGGFSHVIFKEADKAKGDLDHPVCGFFATVHDRMAAGCTPDIDEENYEEFSSHFWAAILGESRTGKKVKSADYDKNGSVSLEEAHAYTILASATTDIPLKTSEAFLRARVQFKDKKNPDFLPKEAPYSQVTGIARPVDKLVLEELSKQLKLQGENRYKEATTKAAAIAKKRKDLSNKDKEKKKSFDAAKLAIKRTLISRWPELANVLTPEAVSLLTEKKDEFVKAVESHAKYKEWKKLEEEREKIAEQRFGLEKEWILYQRFIRTQEHIILATNLAKSKDAKSKKRLQQIISAESKPFSVGS